MKKIAKTLYAALAVATLGACSSAPQFKIEGEVTGADGKMLYLEASALEGIVPMDSVKLNGGGSFSFKGERPASPEFYRLRVEDKVINLSVDSTETVTVQAPYENFATEYSVTGSPNCEKIKELTLKQARLQNHVDELGKAMNARTIGVDDFQDSLAVLLKAYKDDVKINYIFSAPNTAAAYFALFQKLNNYLIFDPLNSKDDIRCFAAVATSLNQHYPHATRSKNLYNIVIKGMKNTRTPQQPAADAPQIAVQETGVIDHAAPDRAERQSGDHRLHRLPERRIRLAQLHAARPLRQVCLARTGNLPGIAGCRRTLLEDHGGQSALDLRARRQRHLFQLRHGLQHPEPAHALPDEPHQRTGGTERNHQRPGERSESTALTC